MRTTCLCGCGQTVRTAQRNIAPRGGKRGYLKGDPLEYRQGHRPRRTNSYRNKRTGIGTSCEAIHRTRAAHALGKPLPLKAVVHHADGSRDEHARLVICQDSSYHNLLHARMRVRAAGGDPNTQRICSRCRCLCSLSQFRGRHDVPRNLSIQSICKSCDNKSRSDRKRKARYTISLSTAS